MEDLTHSAVLRCTDLDDDALVICSEYVIGSPDLIVDVLVKFILGEDGAVRQDRCDQDFNGMTGAVFYLALVGEDGGDTIAGILPSFLNQFGSIDQRTCEQIYIAITEHLQHLTASIGHLAELLTGTEVKGGLQSSLPLAF